MFRVFTLCVLFSLPGFLGCTGEEGYAPRPGATKPDATKQEATKPDAAVNEEGSAPKKMEESSSKTTPAKPSTTEDKAVQEKVSYALGNDAGWQFANLRVEIDLEAYIEGLRDALLQHRSKLNKKEKKLVLMELGMKVRKNRSGANLKEGHAFLLENGKKEGVVTTKSGLQYKIIKAGTGAKPTMINTVVVNYEGRLITGFVFDGTTGGAPSPFQLSGGLIAAWKEALPMMKTGAKWRLFIPARLGYGPRGSPPDIGPNEVLVFDVELVEVR